MEAGAGSTEWTPLVFGGYFLWVMGIGRGIGHILSYSADRH